MSTSRSFRNKLQSTAKTDREGDYLAGQSFTLPNLEFYSTNEVWNFLRTFDCTKRNIRQQMLDHYKFRLNQLSIASERIESRNRKILRDNIALLEPTFIYIIWYQPNLDINDSQITYYSDEE